MNARHAFVFAVSAGALFSTAAVAQIEPYLSRCLDEYPGDASMAEACYRNEIRSAAAIGQIDRRTYLGELRRIAELREDGDDALYPEAGRAGEPRHDPVPRNALTSVATLRSAMQSMWRLSADRERAERGLEPIFATCASGQPDTALLNAWNLTACIDAAIAQQTAAGALPPKAY